MTLFVFSLLNGISWGAVLFLVTSGLSLILGVMGILNLAHGAVYMVGAFVGWTIVVQYGLNFWLAALIGGLSGGLIGLIIERIFLRHLYKQFNEQVLLTFGFDYILVNLAIWVWGARSRAPFTTSLLSGSVSIMGLSYPKARIAIIVIGGILAIGLWWLQNKTRLGAIVRAGMDDKEMTMGLGINLPLISMLVFFLGSFLAGFAGVIGAQVLGAYPSLATDILLLALVVVIIGGVGSVEGALFGSMLIGIIDAFGKALFPEIAMFTIYLAMVISLSIRPWGLLGRKL